MTERLLPNTEIRLPLSSTAAIAIVVAADSFGVEPWEIAVHVLALRQKFDR